MYPPYIPAADAAFDAWLTNFSTLLSAAPATYGLTAGDAANVAVVQGNFALSLAAATDPATRTPVTVAQKDVDRVAAEALVRPLAVQVSLNAAVLPADKVAIGVTVRSTNPTPIPAPITAPELAVQTMVPGLLTLAIKETGAVGKAKPFGATGVELFALTGDAHTALPADCSYVATVTKSPARFQMDPGDAGKKLTIFARYVTASGPGGQAQTGPWSLPLQTISV